MSRFLQCPDCHGVALVIYGDDNAACGTYDKLHANTTEAAVEKHLPKVKAGKNHVEVCVGEIDHPMEEEHFITWVYLETTHGGHLRTLKPGEKPVAKFDLCDGEKPMAVYEYCSKHGLWKEMIE